MTTVSLEDAAFLLSANAESPFPPAGPAAPAVAEASPPPAADEAPPLRKRRPNATPAEDILSGLADFGNPVPPEPAGQPDSPRQKSRGKSGIPDAAATLAALQMLDDATEAQISGQSDEGQA